MKTETTPPGFAAGTRLVARRGKATKRSAPEIAGRPLPEFEPGVTSSIVWAAARAERKPRRRRERPRKKERNARDIGSLRRRGRTPETGPIARALLPRP